MPPELVLMRPELVLMRPELVLMRPELVEGLRPPGCAALETRLSGRQAGLGFSP
jgi:hypothetical protein